MSPEENHFYYMLLHDMLDICIMQNGFAHITYFPHHNPEIRIAYGVSQNVSEQLVDFMDAECESD